MVLSSAWLRAQLRRHVRDARSGSRRRACRGFVLLRRSRKEQDGLPQMSKSLSQSGARCLGFHAPIHSVSNNAAARNTAQGFCSVGAASYQVSSELANNSPAQNEDEGVPRRHHLVLSHHRRGSLLLLGLSSMMLLTAGLEVARGLTSRRD